MIELQLKELEIKQKKIHKYVFDKSGHLFDCFCKHIFNEFKEIECFQWVQYVKDDVFFFEDLCIKYKNNIKHNKKNIESIIERFLSNFDDKFYILKFGNNANIIINENIVTVYEYNCF